MGKTREVGCTRRTIKAFFLRDPAKNGERLPKPGSGLARTFRDRRGQLGLGGILRRHPAMQKKCHAGIDSSCRGEERTGRSVRISKSITLPKAALNLQAALCEARHPAIRKKCHAGIDSKCRGEERTGRLVRISKSLSLLQAALKLQAALCEGRFGMRGYAPVRDQERDRDHASDEGAACAIFRRLHRELARPGSPAGARLETQRHGSERPCRRRDESGSGEDGREHSEKGKSGLHLQVGLLGRGLLRLKNFWHEKKYLPPPALRTARLGKLYVKCVYVCLCM